MNIVLTNDAPRIAGGENYVLHVAEGMRARAHTVIIAPLAGSELATVSRERGFETIEVPYAAGGKEFRAAALLARALRNRSIDIVHTNSNFDRTIAAFAAWRIGARCITSIHSCLPIRHNIVHAIRNSRLIDHFTPVGYSTRRILIEHDRIPAERITVVHIGIPESQIRYSETGRARVRAGLGIGRDVLVAGTLSRLVDFKGHTHLLAAAPAVLSAFPDARILIAGDGPLRARLEQESRERGIAGRVIFAGHRADIADMLSAMDVFVQPSIDNGGETFPVSLIEAQAAGLSAVASDVADIRYIIDPDHSGILLPPARPDLLADALISVFSDPARRASMHDAALVHFASKLTLDRMIDALEAVYKKVQA